MLLYVAFSPAHTINNSCIILKPLPESLSSTDSLSWHKKRRSCDFTDIYVFLLLKDTTDARRCGSHKEGSRSSTGGLKDIKHTTEASSTKCSCEKIRATKHLSTSVTFIYEFKCWLVSARKNGFWRIFLFLFFPLFVPSCKSLGGFLERELME